MSRPDVDAPHPTGKPPGPVDLKGRLFPWCAADQQPVLLAMPGSRLLYLPCFSTANKLRAVLFRAGVAFDSIKHIDNGPEFLSSIPTAIFVIVDPHYVPGGRIRFTQVLRD